VSAPLLVTTASPHVQVIVSNSPTPYAVSVAVHEVNVGTAPSTVTAPRSTVPVAAAAPPAASAIAPVYAETFRSLESVSPSAIVVVPLSRIRWSMRLSRRCLG